MPSVRCRRARSVAPTSATSCERRVVELGADADERPARRRARRSAARARPRAARARSSRRRQASSSSPARRRAGRRRRRRRAAAPPERRARRTRAGERRGTRARAADRPGSSKRRRSGASRAADPVDGSFRYSLAQLARPGSTGVVEGRTSRFVTPPVGRDHDDHDQLGCSSSTSTWRTVADSSGGAETSASRRVTWTSISVVDCSAASTSLRIAVQVERERPGPRLEALEQLVRVEAVAALGGDPTRRGVRVREQPERLELGELAANGRRRDTETGALDEPLRADRLARGDVLLDDAPQDLRLRVAQLRRICRGHLQARRPGARRSRRRRGSGRAASAVERPRRAARPTRPSLRRERVESVARRSRHRGPPSASGSSSRRPSISRSRACVLRRAARARVPAARPPRAPQVARRGCGEFRQRRPSTVETAPIPSPR